MDKINKCVFADGEQGLTQNVMLADDNLLSGVWAYLKPTLAFSDDALHTILGDPDI